MKLNMKGHLKCWLWHLTSLIWAEHKFNCDINGLRKAEKVSTAVENIEAVKKMILENRWITIREFADDVGISFGSWQAIWK